MYDAIVVGSGPNGLAAAITLAQEGCSVLVVEARDTVGGGMRSAELTLPGFVHDICSAIHPLGMGSPFFKSLPMSEFDLEWIQPDIPLAQVLDDGSAVAMYRSLDQTVVSIGRDGPNWRRLMQPLVEDWETLIPMILGPLPLPRHPLTLTRFGLRALWPARHLAQSWFREDRARTLIAGLAAHGMQPLEKPLTTSFALVLAILGHAIGWPFPKGGAQRIPDALARYLKQLGGEIATGWMVRDLADLPPHRSLLLSVSPRSFLHLAADRLPTGYRQKLGQYRYGPGVFKIDYALSEPIPWAAAECRRAGTVHLGGSLAEIAASEKAISRGEHPERPYVLVTQQSLFDATRAPNGQHTLWAYCHVPHGSTVDMAARIEKQIERYAPGFRDTILARHQYHAAAMEAYNPNYVGGDINVGVQDLSQMWTRPTPQWDPYATPLPGVFLCSSATPPGGGVHGMCGHQAAQSALKWLRDRS